MILKDEEIRWIAKEPTDSHIKKMRVEAESLLRNYYSDHTLIDQYLSQINDYENDRQFELRKKYSISNSHLVDMLLKPIDTVFSARGGSVNYGVDDSQSEKLIKALLNVRDGMSLKQYISTIWRERFIVDPNGILYIEVKEGNPYLTFKSIFSIKHYKTQGYLLDWICFESHRKTEKGQYYWVVDDTMYYEVYVSDEKTSIEKKIPNSFGIVPGVVNSPIQNTSTKRRESILSKQTDILDSYLNKNSVKEIYQYLHLYPIYWQYETICPACNGTRMIGENVCTVCNGSGMIGRKDVSSAFVLKPPKDDDSSIAPPPAGYVQPDLETMREQRTELDWLFDKLFFSIWGATKEKAENETATGRFIDVQPVVNKCSTISDIAETVHTFIMNLFARHIYGKETNGTVRYGKRFILETPDQIWNKYLTAREKKAPVSTLNLLLDQYYMTEFANDDRMYWYYYKLMELEPYVHATQEEVMGYPISDQEKGEKIYFESFIESIDVNYVISSPTDKLKSELTIFSNERVKQWQKSN